MHSYLIGIPVIFYEIGDINNAIKNLIDNALKYTEGVPSILIKTKSDDHGVYVSVVDNGMGISKENQKRYSLKHKRNSVAIRSSASNAPASTNVLN